MDADLVAQLGPLAALAGVWEGDKGADVAPSDDRGTEENKFHERITFGFLPRRAQKSHPVTQAVGGARRGDTRTIG